MVIVIGAEALHPDAVASVPDGAVVMAADSGLDHARAAGLTPTVLIGDLDSVSAEGLAWAEGNSSIERHPVDKDATDTELALRHAVGLDPSRIVLMSGGGDRIDHTLAALGALGEVVLTSVPVLEAWWGSAGAGGAGSGSGAGCGGPRVDGVVARLAWPVHGCVAGGHAVAA